MSLNPYLRAPVFFLVGIFRDLRLKRPVDDRLKQRSATRCSLECDTFQNRGTYTLSIALNVEAELQTIAVEHVSG